MKRFLFAAAIIAAASSLPAHAQQQSASYKFLQAVKDAKGDEVTKILDQPGQRIINTRDATTGDGALHIVIRRGDDMYLRYLLSRGADPNLRNGKGDTPLLMAIQYGQNGLVDTLLLVSANPNLANSAGETPLIRAVQRRDLALVRTLLNAGADPDLTDNVAGMSARDYAHADSRSPAIAKVIDEKPKSVQRAIAGPKM